MVRPHDQNTALARPWFGERWCSMSLAVSLQAKESRAMRMNGTMHTSYSRRPRGLAVLSLSLAAACGEPLLLTVGIDEVEAGPATEPSLPRDASDTVDARRVEPDTDAARDAQLAEGFAPSDDGFGNCLALPNLPHVRLVDDAGLLQVAEVNGVLVTTDQYHHCADAGMGSDQLYSLTSGKPILRPGVQYAVRTNNATLVGASFRAAKDLCDRSQITSIPDIWGGPCANVSSSEEASHLRFAGTVFQLPGTASFTFRLCDKPCP